MATKQLVKSEAEASTPEENVAPGTYLVPPVTIFESDEGVTLQVDLPGVSRERVQLQFEQETLTLEGQLSVELGEDMKAVHAELQTPHFRRSFTVGSELESDNISAEMQDGVLTIKIPKRPTARPQKIEIT